jgi:hypothetical protein
MKNISSILIYALALMGLFLILANSCKKDDSSTPGNTVKDIDGNIYYTVTIGTQVWIVENLKVTHYRNGDPIPNVKAYFDWGNLKTGAFLLMNSVSIAALSRPDKLLYAVGITFRQTQSKPKCRI